MRVVFFWWLNLIRLLYPKRRIESYSIMGTIVSPNKILLMFSEVGADIARSCRGSCNLGLGFFSNPAMASRRPDTPLEDTPCNGGIIGIQEDSNIVTTIPYSHYYRVGGPPKIYPLILEQLPCSFPLFPV